MIISKLGHHYLSLEKSFEKKYLFYLFIYFDPNTIIILRENGRSQPEETFEKNRKEQHVTGRKRVIVWTKPFATRRYARHVIITTSLLFLFFIILFIKQ